MSTWGQSHAAAERRGSAVDARDVASRMQNLAQLISTIRSQTAKLGTAAADRSFCSVLRRNCSSARELHSAVAADCKSLGGSSLLSRGQLSKLVHDFESLSARLEDALDQAQHKMRTRAGSRHGGSFVGARSAPASAAPLQPPHPAPPLRRR